MTSVARTYAGETPHKKHPPANTSPEAKAPIVLMVSGGADSIALLLMATRVPLNLDDGRGEVRIAKERLHVLHVNHGLRGLDAQEDEELVRNTASHLGIPCTVVSVDIPALTAATPGESFESVARKVRYEAADKLANDLSKAAGTPRSAARIVTAHTADDRAETFFMNAIKGAGPAGLSSIPFRRNRIVRPLLYKTHHELCDYLRLHNVLWAEDATNEDTSYLRNFVRKKILPLAKEKNDQLVATLASTCDVLNDEDAFLSSIAQREYRSLLQSSSPGVRSLNAHKLAATDVAIGRRIVRTALLDLEPQARLEANDVATILKAVAKQSGSFHVTYGIHAKIENGTLTLRTRAAQGPQKSFHAQWLSVPGSLPLTDGILTADIIHVTPADSPLALAKELGEKSGGNAVFLDMEALQTDTDAIKMWVAPPSPGDILCPLGMHGQSKKLSDVLSGAHIPLTERAGVPVVSVAPGREIVWVAGVRPDTRFAVTAASRALLYMCYQKERHA